MSEFYDPLDYGEIKRNLARTLELSPPFALPPDENPNGPGVYAIYYNIDGGFAPYCEFFRLANEESGLEVPIYVGKASAAGARTGEVKEELLETQALARRLREHANSVRNAENLRLEDFHCRYLLLLPVWIPLAERQLIETYRPLWNSVIDGFGIHAPGSGRGKQARSQWDTVHPGRSFAEDRPDNAEAVEQILSQISGQNAG